MTETQTKQIEKIKTFLKDLKKDLKTKSLTRTEYFKLKEGLIFFIQSPVMMIGVMAESCLSQLNKCFIIC